MKTSKARAIGAFTRTDLRTGAMVIGASPFRFFHFLLERRQGVVPEGVEPVTQFHQAFAAQRINPAHAFAAFLDQACVFQRLEVLRDRGAGDRQAGGEGVHRARPRAQALEHFPARRVGEDGEGSCVSHD